MTIRIKFKEKYFRAVTHNTWFKRRKVYYAKEATEHYPDWKGYVIINEEGTPMTVDRN